MYVRSGNVRFAQVSGGHDCKPGKKKKKKQVTKADIPLLSQIFKDFPFLEGFWAGAKEKAGRTGVKKALSIQPE